MTTGEFADLVKKMRDTQKRWIASHQAILSKDSLAEEREYLEKKVDRVLLERDKRLRAELKEQQGKLFD